MTKPSHPSPAGDPKFARDVARHIDRRRVRRRMLLWTLLFAVIAAAALYLRCGEGFGLGGGGIGPGGGDKAPRPVASGLRCALRVAPSGIAVDGKRMTRDQAVSWCKAVGGADILVTGDARHGDGVALVEALRAAGLTDIIVHEVRAPAADPASPAAGSAAH